MSKVFDGSWVTSNGISGIHDEPAPNDVVYTTEDPLKYQEKKLELQQNKYLQNRWIRANQNLTMSAFANLSNIKLMYRDADLMDSYPEIGAALDLCSEESVQPNPDNGGQIVNVTSKSDRIRGILEDLFVNRLNLQVTAQMVIRAMCKYGNQFMLLDIDKDLGVKGWRQLPVGEVERIENGIVNPYGGAQVINANTKEGSKDTSTRFLWTSEVGGDLVPFRNWQIAHFRLLHNSIFLPYGVSMLSSARRHFRMLALLEDNMLIYHIEKGQERRVFKIYVGEMDDQDIGPYVEQIANQFKRTPIVDPMTGQLDLRKNILPVWRKTPIPLLDGRTISIEELAKEYEEGKENYVYSIQDKTHQIVPGKVVWCGKNYTAEKLYKIVLDDDSYMVMAGEHEVIMRDGSRKRADELVSGESVMPYNVLSSEVKVVEVIAGDDVYCMTVEGLDGEQDRHNFALKTFKKCEEVSDSGCFVSNCNTEDYFLATRDTNLPSPIETLQGAKNLEAIEDIKYIQKKVCAALRIPQSFLNFEEATGDGKNLALMDVRFARTINRFQQAFLMELTKIATIHLYLLGFEDDLTNFNLSMNNPSTQAEQLELENLQKKVSIIRDAVSDPGNGIPVMSIQEAWKRVLKLSDNEIKQMLEEIRLEKALAAEYEKTSQIIKRSGIFDTVDRIYGEPGAEYMEDAGNGQGGPQGGGPMGGGGGGFGEGIQGLGAPGSEDSGDISGEEGSEPVGDMNASGGAPDESGGATMEGRHDGRKLIREQAVTKNDILVNRAFNMIVENMGEKEKSESVLPRVDVYDKNLMINEEMNSVIHKLDDLLNDSLDEILTEDFKPNGESEE
jgi:hypothetical protein